MSLLLPLLREAVVDGFLLANTKRKVKDLKLAGVLYTIAALLFIPVFGFLSFAGYLVLEQTMTPLDAALSTAGILAAVAICFFVCAKIVLRRHARLANAQETKMMEVLGSACVLLERRFKSPVRGYPKTALGIAGLIGLLTARRLR